MSIKAGIAAAIIATSQTPETSPDIYQVPEQIELTSETVKTGVSDFLGTKLEPKAGLKGLKNQIILAKNDQDTMMDAVQLPPFIKSEGDKAFDWYSSLSQIDKDKVNNFYNGLIQLPSNKSNRELGVRFIMSNYIRFIKATSPHPGELFGFAKSSLDVTIKTIRNGGFPEELATRLTQYIDMADKADKNFKLAKAELDELNTKIAELIKKRDKLRAENDKLRAENDKLRAEIDALDKLISTLENAKKLLSQKSV